MALNTKQDYQREIKLWQDENDDLQQKIIKAKESLDYYEKQIKLNKSEIDKLQKEWQDKLDKLEDEKGATIDKLAKYSDEYTDLEIELKKLENEDKYVQSVEGENSVKKYIDETKSKMKKVQKEKDALANKIKEYNNMIKQLRSEDFDSKKNAIISNLADLEARKQDVLAGLEARALETEKDYQREYDAIYKQAEAAGKKLTDESFKIVEELNRAYKEMKAAVDKYNSIKADEKQIAKKIEASDNKYAKMLDNLVAEAKKKGFKIKEKSY